MLAEHIKSIDADHNLVDLNLAYRMQQDDDLIEFYLAELPKIHQAISFIRSGTAKMKKAKQKFNESKSIIFSKIEEIFNHPIRVIEEAEQELNSYTKCLTKYKSDLSNEGKDLIDKYLALGSKGFIKSNIESV